jgi:hypothetical protein
MDVQYNLISRYLLFIANSKNATPITRPIAPRVTKSSRST